MSEEMTTEATAKPRRRLRRARAGMVRVMVSLPEGLVTRARVHAVRSCATLSRIVEDELIELLARP
jgi:hypothetical protein